MTTVESSHSESDDAQPPELPEDVYGSRKDPAAPSPGIYGEPSFSFCMYSDRLDVVVIYLFSC